MARTKYGPLRKPVWIFSPITIVATPHKQSRPAMADAPTFEKTDRKAQQPWSIVPGASATQNLNQPELGEA